MAENLNRRPAEIFGYPIGNRSAAARDARQKYWCPFRDGPCIKKSRLIDFPFGVCSVEYDGDIHTICPQRFEEIGSTEGVPRVLEDIAVHYFGNTDNTVVFSEVRLPNVGNIDYVIIKHKPMQARYGFKSDGFSPQHSSIFALYDMVTNGDCLTLTPTRFISTTVEEVYQAMRNNPAVPNKDAFVEELNKKLRLKLCVT